MPRLDADPSALPRTLPADRSMAENKTANWRSLRPGIEADRCTGCLLCWKFCPEACIRLGEKVPSIVYDYCKGCGVCVKECPQRCISLSPQEAW